MGTLQPPSRVRSRPRSTSAARMVRSQTMGARSSAARSSPFPSLKFQERPGRPACSMPPLSLLRYEVIRSVMPRRSRPATAMTMALYSISALSSLASRVPMLPRTSLKARWGKWRLSWATRRRELVPTTEPLGRSERVRMLLARVGWTTRASRGSFAFGDGAENAVVGQLGGHVFEGVDDEVDFLVLQQHFELGGPEGLFVELVQGGLGGRCRRWWPLRGSRSGGSASVSSAC